jgi:hypothetical protein
LTWLAVSCRLVAAASSRCTNEETRSTALLNDIHSLTGDRQMLVARGRA